MTIVGVMACDPAGLIGKSPGVPWNYPEDIAFYHKKIFNQSIILGYNTYLELPPDLFGAANAFVFTRKEIINTNPKVCFVHDLNNFINLATLADKTLYMLGGADIATLFFENNLIDEFFLTEISKYYEGNTYLRKEYLNHWPKKLITQNKDFSIYHYVKAK